ncbi:hypothetical protein [Actinomadura macra]|uniref:hypothetical protein n=1 Tax=Actinomadura macra TaxID=46164 RepID=UPI0012FCC756|nr:hypothetical protein [Actinomadura macra]
MAAIAFYDELENQGIRKTRAALIAAYAEEAACPALGDEVMRPADEALTIAVEVVTRAFDNAMRVHGVPERSIGTIAATVRTDIEQVVATHIDRRRRLSESPSDVPGQEGEAGEGTETG